MAQGLIIAGTNTPILIAGTGATIGTPISIAATVDSVGNINTSNVYLDVDTNLSGGRLYTLFTTTPGSAVFGDIISWSAIISPGITRIVKDALASGTTYTALWYVEATDGTRLPTSGFYTHGTTVSTPSSVTIPTQINPTTININESQPTGQSIATFNADGGNVSFSEILDTDNKFTLNTNGSLSLSASVLNSSSPYALTVRATNTAGSFDQVVSVVVASAQTSAADATVSTVSALQAKMAAWSGTTNWNATSAGLSKTDTDERVIDVDADLAGYTLSGYDFSQRVTIRSTGTFAVPGTWPYDPTCGSDCSGTITLNNCTNVRLNLLSMKMIAMSGCTDCGLERCSISGTAADANSVATADGVLLEGNVGLYIIDCRFAYFRGFGCAVDNTDNLVFTGNVFEHMSDDSFKKRSNNTSKNWQVMRNWWAAKYVGTSLSHHDFVQFQNGDMSGLLFWGNVGARLAGTSWLVQGGLYMSNGQSADNCVAEQNIFAYDGLRGLNGNTGLNKAVRNNTVVRVERGAIGSVQEYWAPYITANWQISERNIVTAKGTWNNAQEGTDGHVIYIGESNNAAPDFSEYTDFWVGVPGGDRSIGRLEPKVGAATHWGFGGTKIGAWERSEEIFSTGIHPGNVGWPVAEAWERTYNTDTLDASFEVATNYTGSYDSDGNNV
jgi:hypothetical protein